MQEPITPVLEETLAVAKRFLLVCEGKNTEPLYFESFLKGYPVPTKEVETVKTEGGYGGGKMYLINEAKKLADSPKYKDYDEVWCIFDYDVKYGHSRQKEDFDNAVSEALRNGYRVAFSNDCFELWFVLHYKPIQNEHHRQEYYDMLTELWKTELKSRSYESCGKDAAFCKQTYKRLLPLQEQAVKRAKQLHAVANDGRPSHQMNPCTTVYELVEELNQYLVTGYKQ